MVIYDDDTALKRTMTACDRLVKSLWSTVDIEFRWWRTRFLADPDLAAGAAREAAEADLFIVSSASETKPAAQLQDWFGNWAEVRSGRAGALASLNTSRSTDSARRAEPEELLRDVCQKAHLEFLGNFSTTGKAAA